MFNIENYIERKKAKLLSVAKIGSGFAISQKRFNPETGEEAAPLVEGFHLNDIEKVKIDLQKAIADTDALVADINNL